MNNHHGQTIEHIVRRNGYNISDLALQLGVNRRTLYNYFGNTTIKPSVILQIGGILRHDFSKEFPEIFTVEDFKAAAPSIPSFTIAVKDSTDDDLYKEKYVSLLEKYNDLLTDLLIYA